MRAFRRTLEQLLVVVLTLAMLSLIGCRKRQKLPPDTTTTTEPSMAAYTLGEKVEVEWNGSWWKAEIIGVNGSLYRVHYTGWSSKWDENVTIARMRPPTGSAKIGTEVPGVADQAAPSGWKVGDKVDVSWNGSWWAASIIGVNGALYRVHYTGWSSSWDENVTAARIRPATAGAKRGSGN